MEKIEEQRLREDLMETKKLMLRMNPDNVLLRMLSGSCTFDSDKYDSLYAFGTEDMKTYYKEFGKPKSFLSICASGDQIINAALSGATVIDAFDCNRLCRHALSLKVAALKKLSKEEFIEFFDSFSPLLFTKFAEEMPEEDLIYWGTIYQMFDVRQAGMFIKDFLFSYKKLSRSVITRINPYLLGSNYKKAQEAIGKTEINYIDADFYNLPTMLGDKTYDAMNFSNIYEYINYGKETGAKKAHEYYTFLMNEMFPRLNNNGAMMAAYTYAFSDKVNEQFKELYKLRKGKLTYPGALNIEEYQYYLMGLTTQNLAYSTLYDNLGSMGEDITKIRTEHIQYGQSMDMSSDTAVFIKKR